MSTLITWYFQSVYASLALQCQCNKYRAVIYSCNKKIYSFQLCLNSHFIVIKYHYLWPHDPYKHLHRNSYVTRCFKKYIPLKYTFKKNYSSFISIPKAQPLDNFLEKLLDSTLICLVCHGSALESLLNNEEVFFSFGQAFLIADESD